MSKKQIRKRRLEKIFSYQESRPKMDQPRYTFKEVEALVISYFTDLIECTSDAQYDSEVRRVYTLLGAEAIGFQVDDQFISDTEVLESLIGQMIETPEVLESLIEQILLTPGPEFSALSKTQKISAVGKFYDDLGLSGIDDELIITSLLKF